MAKRKPVRHVSEADKLIAALKTMGKEECPKEDFEAAFKVAMVSGSRILAKGLKGTFQAIGNVLDNVQRVRKTDG